jgi:hypothetical protein
MIDIHTHPVLIQEYGEKFPTYVRAAREVFGIGNHFQPLETFFLQLDVAGIDKAVLLPIACERARGDAVSSNEQVAELCQLSERFIGFASVDPFNPQACNELELAVKGMGLKGLKLDAALQGFDLNDGRVLEVYDTAAALGIPVLVHTGMSWAPGVPLEPSRPLLLETAIHRFANLNFILAHWGWPWIWDATALALKYPNVFLDTSCLYYDGPREFFQHVFSREIPTTLIERSLAQKALFGSNYPRVEIKNMVKALRSLPLSNECQEKILCTNAERLLGIQTPMSRPSLAGPSLALHHSILHADD